jgi:hypothetical protein
MKLLTHHNEAVTIQSVSETHQWTTVYNLRVAEFHTYFVGTPNWGFSVWAHNAYVVEHVGGGWYKIKDTVKNEFVIDPVTNKPYLARGQTGKLALKDIVTDGSVRDKLTGYLLNPDHPDGGPKARWFREALGFTLSNMENLARQLKLDFTKVVDSTQIEFGMKYRILHRIIGANGKVIDVLFVWIKYTDGEIRLVTAIPTSRQ